MKKLRLFGCMFSLAFLCFYGCTNDSINETAKDEESFSTTKVLEDVDKEKMSVLITYVEGLSEADKESYRKFYQGIKVLESWERCEQDLNSETWVVNCGIKGYQCRNGNPPTKPDKPVAGQTERMLPYANCEDL